MQRPPLRPILTIGQKKFFKQCKGLQILILPKSNLKKKKKKKGVSQETSNVEAAEPAAVDQTSTVTTKEQEKQPAVPKKKKSSLHLKILSKTESRLTEAADAGNQEEDSTEDHQPETGKKKNGEINDNAVGTTAEPLKRKKAKDRSYTLFIGNLSYDTTREDIFAHFHKCGYIKEVRVPRSKEDNSPRGFAYLEVDDSTVYEKVLSMHHSFLKKRRINVECTFGGSNKSTKRKALIKTKTCKMRFLTKEGKISSAKQRQWGKKTFPDPV